MIMQLRTVPQLPTSMQLGYTVAAHTGDKG